MSLLEVPLGLLGVFVIVFVIYLILFSVGTHMKDQDRIQGAPSSHLRDAPEYHNHRRAA